jgi:hypothetical protein
MRLFGRRCEVCKSPVDRDAVVALCRSCQTDPRYWFPDATHQRCPGCLKVVDATHMTEPGALCDRCRGTAMTLRVRNTISFAQAAFDSLPEGMPHWTRCSSGWSHASSRNVVRSRAGVFACQSCGSTWWLCERCREQHPGAGTLEPDATDAPSATTRCAGCGAPAA